MSDCAGSMAAGPIAVWNDGTTAWMFFALMDAVDSHGHKLARPSIEMSNKVNSIKARAAVRMSNDGAAWDTPVAVGTVEASANGITVQTSYSDISATTNAKLKLQYGVEVAAVTAGDVGLAIVTLRIDHKGA